MFINGHSFLDLGNELISNLGSGTLLHMQMHPGTRLAMNLILGNHWLQLQALDRVANTFVIMHYVCAAKTRRVASCRGIGPVPDDEIR